ncbi:MAG TPA: UDP-N-acetylglucosamine 1-carboxyvinyltransferase [Actinomycetota bacterium]|nr:UDP-N-acetylglucosamine 1-carboxyvinyltransferase [Actinomycetota bacterium]
MDHFLITGGARLSGSIPIAGAKNSALKLMAAALLAPGRTVLSNLPRIQDCLTMGEVLQHLGADVAWEDDLAIDASDVLSVEAPYELVSRMRASILVLGPLLARCGRARVAMPGGCNIGSRKIDLHVRGLEKMGARFSSEHGFLEGVAPRGLSGAIISLDFPSVGATENVMMAAVAARGTTVIENAAREPELSDLAEFLQEMGGRIQGVGTPTIEIEGTGDFHPVRHSVIPDRIEAGTFAIAACVTGGHVLLERARGDHMDLILAKLTELGADVLVTEAGVAIGLRDRPRAVDFVTLPYPGFPTDLQPQMMALLSVAEGTSIVTENVFESRFMFVDELNRMGADIRTEGHHAVIRGVDHLSAAPVRALDIRAGAAMVIAALCADGVTVVEDMYHVDRGYQDFEAKLLGLGAEVRRERRLTPALW